MALMMEWWSALPREQPESNRDALQKDRDTRLSVHKQAI